MGKIKQFWKSLGPGLITGAADNDPAGIATYSIAGAQTGYGTLWILLFILPFMIAIQEMSARIGALSGCGLAGNIKRYYPKWILCIAAIAIIGANIFNIGADIYGMAGALNLLLPIDIRILAVIVSLTTVLMTIFLRYRQIVAIFKWLALSLFAYLVVLLGVHPNWKSILIDTFIPTIHLDKQFFTVLFAVVGTTISPYLYFWQASEEAEEAHQHHPGIKVCRYHSSDEPMVHQLEWDTRIGMLFSNLISFFIVSLTAATIFHVGAQNINSLRDAAQALEPIAGSYTYYVFTLGIVSAGFLAIPVLAGSAAYVLAELFGWSASLDKPFTKARQFYLAIAAAIGVGILIPFLGISPLQALFYSAVINGLISPLLIFLVLHMSSNPAIVGPHRLRTSTHVLGHISFLLMTAGAAFTLLSL